MGKGDGLLANKVVMITGGGSGIGHAACLLFAEEGADVCIVDRLAQSAEATAAAIIAAGGSARAWTTDISDEQAVAQTVDDIVRHFGRLDGAFTNAGIEMANKLVPDLTMPDWTRMMDINLTGVFVCMKYQIRAMAANVGPAKGAIVNMSSGDGIIGAPYASDYVAAKHGVLGLTRAASCEARYTGVRVNALLPGLILTPMVEERLLGNPTFEAQVAPMVERHSIGRFGQPREVAEAACWLISDRSSFINGSGLTVDGGYTAR